MEPSRVVPRTPLQQQHLHKKAASASRVLSSNNAPGTGGGCKETISVVSPVREYIRNRTMSAPPSSGNSNIHNAPDSGRKMSAAKKAHKVAFLRTTRRGFYDSSPSPHLRARSLRFDKENARRSPMVNTPSQSATPCTKRLLSSGKRSMNTSHVPSSLISSARSTPRKSVRSRGTQTKKINDDEKRISTSSDSSLAPSLLSPRNPVGAMPLVKAASFLHGALQKKEEHRRAVIAKIERLTVEIHNASDDAEVVACTTSSDDDASTITKLSSKVSSAQGRRRKPSLPNIRGLKKEHQLWTAQVPKTPSAKQLKHERALLQEEQSKLKDEIQQLCDQIAMVEGQLQASQSHARCLSSSTIEWATIMSQNTDAAVAHEKMRQLYEGVCAKKYATKKKFRITPKSSCRMRFVVCDPNGNWIAWSRSLAGVERLRSLSMSKTPKCKSIDTSDIASLFYGRSAVDAASQHGVAERILPSCAVLLLMRSTSNVVVFEFASPGRATDFFLALQSFLSPHLPSTEVLLTPAQVDYEREMCIRDENVSSLGRASRALASSSRSSSASTASSHVVESAVASFQASAETVSTFEEFQSMLAKDEISPLPLEGGSARTKGPPRTLVLPLMSGSTSRNLAANAEQTRKDLLREKSICFNAHEYDLGGEVKLVRFLDRFEARVRSIFQDLCKGMSDSSAHNIAQEILLAASRTVIEGDVFTLCHRLFSTPTICLCPVPPNQEQKPSATSSSLGICPINIFIALDGLITIESHSTYRIVWVQPSGDDMMMSAGPREAGVVRARCIEHIYLDQLAANDASGESEKNVRHVSIAWGAR